jgi:hypothetical protein
MFFPSQPRIYFISILLTKNADVFDYIKKFTHTYILSFNPLMPNGRNAPLTSRRCILNIYSTNIRTEYFKHAA